MKNTINMLISKMSLTPFLRNRVELRILMYLISLFTFEEEG